MWARGSFTKTKWQGGFYLGRLKGDLDTHGAPDAWKLASQSLFGFMSYLWYVFDGQIELEEMSKKTYIKVLKDSLKFTVNFTSKEALDLREVLNKQSALPSQNQ